MTIHVKDCPMPAPVRATQLLGEPVGEVLLLFVSAQVYEWQHRDRVRRRGECDGGRRGVLRDPDLVSKRDTPASRRR